MTVNFSPAQQAALEAEGDTLVCAAAGSGKTRVLVGRIVRAVVEQNVPLSAIVAVTFTEKAAQEIRERVATEFLERGMPDRVAQLESAAIGTIHGLCARYLREYAYVVGLDPRFSVLDGAQAAYLQSQALDSALAAASDESSLRVRARYGDKRLRGYVLSAYDAASQRIDGHVAFRAEADDATATADADYLQRLCAGFQHSYEGSRRAANALDFDDLQRHMLQALESDEVVTRLRHDVQRLLVDEFQDTNEVQCAILERIGRGRMFTVGDEWQSIYRFRKADVSVFRRRSERTQPLRMTGNYRSRPAILSMVNHLFGRVFGARYVPVDAETDEIQECAAGPVSTEVLVVRRSGSDSREREAAAVARRIRELVDAGADPGEIVVLLARQTHASTFEQQLRAQGLPTLLASARGYYDQQQVRDVTALLTWARNRHDDRAALSVLASPYAGLQWRDLWELRQRGETIWEALASSTDSAHVAARELRDAVAAVAENGTIVDVVDHAVHGTNYQLAVLASSDGRRRMANMRKLVELAAGALRLGINDIGGFLDLVSAQRSIGSGEGEASIADEASGAVRLMTVHAAKGLEFPYVFVCDLSNNGRRGQPTLMVDADGGAWFETVDVDGLTRSRPTRLVELQESEALEQVAEEQRLMYVAFTRAEDYLCFSGVFDQYKSGAPKVEGPLCWLLDALDIDPIAVEADDLAHPDVPLVARVIAPVAHSDDEASAIPASLHSDVVEPVAFTMATPIDLSAHRVEVQPIDAQLRRRGGDAEGVIPVRDVAHDAAAARRGRLVHQQLAAVLNGSLLARDIDDTQIRELVASDTFGRMLELGGRAEVPFHHVRDGVLESGRFDFVARDGDHWTIVDYKATLPDARDRAWAQHGEQMQRYIDAARAAGAREVTLTLVPVDRPAGELTWTHVFEDADATVPAVVRAPKPTSGEARPRRAQRPDRAGITMGRRSLADSTPVVDQQVGDVSPVPAVDEPLQIAFDIDG